jgi:hypothetical protein
MLANYLRAPVRMVFACHLSKSLLKALNIVMDFCPLTKIHIACFIFERKNEWIRRLHYIYHLLVVSHPRVKKQHRARAAT